MKQSRYLGSAILVFVAAWAAIGLSGQAQQAKTSAQTGTQYTGKKIVKSDAEWKQKLTPEQYAVLREQGTERAFTGKYAHNMDAGTYYCAACGLELFSSKTKFDSGTGWPSFYDATPKSDVILRKDADGERIEVVCSRCGGHLGHVFNDGPLPTGKRYCMNSVALDFKKETKKPVAPSKKSPKKS